MADAIWNFRDETHRDVFGALLSPLIVASRSRDFVDPGRAKDQLIAWVMSLKDIPLPLLEEGRERLMSAGVTWMPRPGDLRQACCDIVDERRKVAAKLADDLSKDCAQCGGTKYQSVRDEAGVERVKKCWCFTRGLELIAEAGQPITRPQLTERSEAEA